MTSIEDEIIKRFLASGATFSMHDHAPIISSRAAYEARGMDFTLAEGTKALIVRVGGGYTASGAFALLAVPGDSRFDATAVSAQFGLEDVRLAKPEELASVNQGVPIGGIPPFGSLFGLKTYCDARVLDKERMVFNAGRRDRSISCAPRDYASIEAPIVGSFTTLE